MSEDRNITISYDCLNFFLNSAYNRGLVRLLTQSPSVSRQSKTKPYASLMNIWCEFLSSDLTKIL